MNAIKPEPKISIIIPNLHSPIVDRTIESVLAQKTVQPFEVIVVGMDKFNLVEQFQGVNFIQTPAPVGAAEARNIGIRSAQGEWLFFIDSDCIAQPGWIEALTAAINEGWQVVGSLQPSASDGCENIQLAYQNETVFIYQLSGQ